MGRTSSELVTPADNKHGIVEQTPSQGSASPDLDNKQAVVDERSSSGSQGTDAVATNAAAVDAVANSKTGWFAYFKTRNFWIVFALGQIISMALVGGNILSRLLGEEGTSIPAFQNMLYYIPLFLIYGPITMYKYGWRKFLHMQLYYSWRYFVFAFMDVQGNYFTVLAYRYSNQLSIQLINFWAIVTVVFVSFVFLKVRYSWSQVAGVFITLGGMGCLLAGDSIQGYNNYEATNKLKGDLFALLGATFFGLTNSWEEKFVSEKPVYEVLGQIGFYGTIISGVQTGIFDRDAWHTAVWNGKVAGYFVGFAVLLVIFYSLATIIFRMSSAAFFNISLLTGNFWTIVIGVKLFKFHIHYLYPVAFVLITIGLIVYFFGGSALGDARKPWLGADQQKGINGVGTAKRKAERGDVNAIV